MKKIVILGYGIEGQDAEGYFKNQKSKIKILDQKFNKNYLKDLDKYDLVVRSPGVYPYKPELKNAKVTTPIQIFFENCPGKIIGVTGTKGKGTTATLIYEILKKAGKEVYLAGNIGKPYLELLSVISHKSYTILEMSSFQLI
ncbi:MAG: UDP-N-acetylmuramoylalanine-D-glutamate ligase, partial [Candidatus Woesebacteria bacterium GW2011_GWB1_41_10]